MLCKKSWWVWSFLRSNKKLNICVIGSGFAGISAATNLAKAGHNVFVLEKNSSFGGRARRLKAKGFSFDMGPSWYWMPDVFEKYFKNHGEKIEDYIQLKRLNPSYKVFFSKNHKISMPSEFDKIKIIFEKYEKGSGKKLEELTAPEDGLLITLRQYPIVYEKEPIAIMLSAKDSWQKIGDSFKSMVKR